MQRLERKLAINTIMDILNGNQCYPEDLFDIPSISSSPEQQKELERLYHDGLDYLDARQYSKAKLKFLLLESKFPNFRRS